MKSSSNYDLITLSFCLLISTHAAADTRCEADQLSAVGSYCRAILNCSASYLANPGKAGKCLLTANNAFDKRYNKARAAAFMRGYDCDYRADVATANELFFNESLSLNLDILQGWEPIKAKNRWYKSLLNTVAASCRTQLNIEAGFAKDSNGEKRQAALLKNKGNVQNKLVKLIDRTSFAYSGLENGEIIDSLNLFANNAVTYLRPNLGGVFSVSAHANLADSIFIDSDTNNIDVEAISNSAFDVAQRVSVPSMVGGYVREEFPLSNPDDPGDPWDIYRVTLTANQVIALSIGNATADLDLYLYDLATNEIAKSEGLSGFESLTTTTAGEYYVAVYAYADAANYALSFGQQSSGQTASSKAEFVPGEIIVRMKEKSLPAIPASSNRGAQAQQMAGNVGLSLVHGASDRDMLWKLSDDDGERQRSLQSLGAKAPSLTTNTQQRSVAARPNLAADTLQAIKALRKRADVASADLNYIRKPTAVPNDPYYSRQWHYPMISLPAAWDTTTGLNSIVAVIDTGVLLGHPDLQGQLVTGYDFISNKNNGNDGNGIDDDPNDAGDNPGGSHSFHGTHVAGTVAATSNNATGGAGVAWNAKIMPLRVLGVDGGTDYDIIQAMRYAARLSNDSGTLPDRRADVINLSLGGPGSSSSARLTVSEVRAAGVIVVAAAGNEASSALFYPAAYDGVISVSAVDTQKQLAPYSNFGSSVDIAAPGGDTSKDRNGDGFSDGILSTLADGDLTDNTLTFNYKLYQGTSMATPHVAGVFALMKSANPNLTPAQLDTLLGDGQLSDDIGSAGRDNKFGHGLINAQRAVIAASGGSSQTPAKLGTAPDGLNFGVGVSSMPLNLFNAGAGELTVTSVQSDQPWLTVQSTAVDAAGLGDYTVTVDRSALTDGIYNASLSIVASSGSSTLPVLMRVGGSIDSDTGLSYFVLINVATGNLYQVDGLPTLGVYQLNFSDIPKGDYLLLGGTDMDNDGYLCADGELCGGYPSIEQLRPITIADDLSNLTFSVNFPQSLQSTLGIQNKLEGKLPGKLDLRKGIARTRGEQSTKAVKRIGLGWPL